MSVFQYFHFFFIFFLGGKDAVISECHISEQAICFSTQHGARLASSVEIMRISWADSLIATAAWHACALCRFCGYMHYELELQNRNKVYLLKRIVLITIFYSVFFTGRCLSLPFDNRCK